LLFFFFSFSFLSSIHDFLNQPNQDYTHSSIRKEKKTKSRKRTFRERTKSVSPS
jgi:hypothetical protein